MSGRKHSLFFGITSRTLLSICAIFLLASYLSIFINPAKAWFMTIFGLLYVPLLVLNIVLLLWAAVRRSKAAVIPLLALLPSAFVVGKFYRAEGKEQPDAHGIKIVSYNVGRFSLYSNSAMSSCEECADSVFEFLKKQDADIICLQEFFSKNPDRIGKMLARRMKGYDIQYFVNVNDAGGYGNVTMSRFPAIVKGRIAFDHSSNMALYSGYVIGRDTLRVYNCHFESYNLSLSRLATAFRKDYRVAMKQAEEKMKRSITRRPKQVEQVLQDIEQCGENVIVAGDFNDNPMSYTYQRLCRHRKDSFEEAGSGSGSTFSLLSPFLRIDYILFPEEYRAFEHKVMHKDFSDHYPISTIIDRL